MKKPPISDQQSTVEALLKSSKRTSRTVPIRWTFVQGEDARGKPEAGPLARIVRSHDERALDLYLLLKAVAVAEPWSSTKDARVWARAMGLVNAQGDHDISAISKTWRRLEKQQLVRREREGRLVCVTVLREDGSGDPYSPPGGPGDGYLKLPFEYWAAPRRWYRTLDLPEKALLLVALSLSSGFVLPEEKGRDWYGLSPDTTGRGLRGLRREGLLQVETELKEAPLAPEGFTRQSRYTLVAPFRGRPGRQGAVAKAQS